MIDLTYLNSIDFDCNLKPDFKYYLFLAKKDKVDFVYNTSALEGNPFTYPEVETLLEGITVGGHRLSDERMILNQNRSWEELLKLVTKKEFNLSKKTFCYLHSFVAFEEALIVGEFRDGEVNIGGTKYHPPKAKELSGIYEDGIKKIQKITNPIIKAIVFFLFGAKMQFFYDGNKRTSRLMMNGILLLNGYPILNIKAKDKLEFNQKMIAFYENGIEEVLEYLLNYYKKQNQHLRREA